MEVLLSVSTVLFVILCVILIIIILLQSDKSAGMGILGGSSQSAFGSSTANVITKISAIMIAIFMLGSLGLAVLEANKSEALEKKLKVGKESMKIEKDKDKETEKEKNNIEEPADKKKDISDPGEQK